MKTAQLSIWNNKWQSVFDFTPKAGEEHYVLSTEVNVDYVKSLEWMKAVVSVYKEVEKVESIDSISEVLERVAKEEKNFESQFTEAVRAKLAESKQTEETQQEEALKLLEGSAFAAQESKLPSN